MTLISTILVTLVAVEFFYIMYLETIVPTSETTSRVFKWIGKSYKENQSHIV